MRKPLGIIFDYGDTILHLNSVNPVAGNRRLLELVENSPGITLEDIQSVVDGISPWLDRTREESMIEVSCRAFNRLLYEPLGVTFKVGPGELEREFWRSYSEYVPVPGIYELLDALDARGVPYGILSNTIFSASVLSEELARHDLARRFAFIIASADYGLRKPHEYIFRVAVKKMGLNPADVWLVGDTPRHDIKGALAAGLFPVWLNWRHEPRTLDGDYLEVTNLDELRKIIKKLV